MEPQGVGKQVLWHFGPQAGILILTRRWWSYEVGATGDEEEGKGFPGAVMCVFVPDPNCHYPGLGQKKEE